MPRVSDRFDTDREGQFDTPVISSDHAAVGVRVVRHDLPTPLIVYSNGRQHAFIGDGTPIFEWEFADAGTLVAYRQEPPHFGCFQHYELRDIASERLLDS